MPVELDRPTRAEIALRHADPFSNVIQGLTKSATCQDKKSRHDEIFKPLQEGHVRSDRASA